MNIKKNWLILLLVVLIVFAVGSQLFTIFPPCPDCVPISMQTYGFQSGPISATSGMHANEYITRDGQGKVVAEPPSIVYGTTQLKLKITFLMRQISYINLESISDYYGSGDRHSVCTVYNCCKAGGRCIFTWLGANAGYCSWDNSCYRSTLTEPITCNNPFAWIYVLGEAWAWEHKFAIFVDGEKTKEFDLITRPDYDNLFRDISVENQEEVIDISKHNTLGTHNVQIKYRISRDCAKGYTEIEHPWENVTNLSTAYIVGTCPEGWTQEGNACLEPTPECPVGYHFENSVCVPDTPTEICGNAICGIGETIANCPADCGEEPPITPPAEFGIMPILIVVLALIIIIGAGILIFVKPKRR